MIWKLLSELQQYSQQENIEFGNIPGGIQQKDLEKYIIDLLGIMNVKIQSYDIVVIQRIGKSNWNNRSNIILRFPKGKNAVLTLKNQRNLKSSNIEHYI